MSALVTSSEALAVGVACTNEELTVVLDDGRSVSVPLAWFPRLLHATEKQRKKWEFIGGGIGVHWDAIDEEISIASLLQPEKFMRIANAGMRPAALNEKSPTGFRGAVRSPRRKA